MSSYSRQPADRQTTASQSGWDHYPGVHPRGPNRTVSDHHYGNAYNRSTRDPPAPSRYSSPKSGLSQYRNPLRGHTDGVQYASFSTAGKFLITASRDCTAKIWQSTGPPSQPLRCVDTLPHAQRVFQCFVSDDATHAVTTCADGAIRAWLRRTHSRDPDVMVIRKKDCRFARACQISSDGQFVVATFYTGTRTPIPQSRSQFMSSFCSAVIMKDTRSRQVLFDISVAGKVDQCRMSSSASVIALGCSLVNPAETIAEGCTITILDRAGNRCHTFRDILPNDSVCSKWDLSLPGDRLAVISADRKAILIYEYDRAVGWTDTPVFLSARDAGLYSQCSFAENGKYVMAVVGRNQDEWKSMRVFSVRKRNVLYEIPCMMHNCQPLSIEPTMTFCTDSYGQYEQIRMICKDNGDFNPKTVDILTSKFSIEPSTNISKPLGGKAHESKKRDSNYNLKNDNHQCNEISRKFRDCARRVPANSSKWQSPHTQIQLKSSGDWDRPHLHKNCSEGDEHKYPSQYEQEPPNVLQGSYRRECRHIKHEDLPRGDAQASLGSARSGAQNMPRRVSVDSAEAIGISQFPYQNKNPDRTSERDFLRTETEMRHRDSHATSSYFRAGETSAAKNSRSLSRDPRIRAKSILKKKSLANYNPTYATTGDPSPFAIVGNASSLDLSPHAIRQLHDQRTFSPPLKRQKCLSLEAESYPVEKYQRNHADQRNSDRTDTSSHLASEVTAGDNTSNDLANSAAGSLLRGEQVPNSSVEPASDQEPVSEEGPSHQSEPLEDGELRCPSHPNSACPRNSSTPTMSRLSSRRKENTSSKPQLSSQKAISGNNSLQSQIQNESMFAKAAGASKVDVGDTGPRRPRIVANNILDHGDSNGKARKEAQKPCSAPNVREVANLPSLTVLPDDTLKGRTSTDKIASNSTSNLDFTLSTNAICEVVANADLLVHMPLPNNSHADSRDASSVQDNSSDDNIRITRLSRRRAARRRKTLSGDSEKTVSISQRRSRQGRRQAGKANRRGQKEIQAVPGANAQEVDDSQSCVRNESVGVKSESHLKSVSVNCAEVPANVQDSALKKAGGASDLNTRDSLATPPSGQAVGSGNRERKNGCCGTEGSSKTVGTCLATGKSQNGKNDRIATSAGASSADRTKAASSSQVARDVGVHVNMKSVAGCAQVEHAVGTNSGQESGVQIPAKVDGVLLKAEQEGNGQVRIAKLALFLKSEDIVSMLQRKARLVFDGAADRVSTCGQQYITGVQAYRKICEMVKTSRSWVGEEEIARIVYGKTGTENICTETMFVQAVSEVCSEAQTRRRPLLEKIFVEALQEGEKTLLAFHAGALLKRALGVGGESPFAHLSNRDLAEVFIAEGCGMLINVEAFVVGAEKVICASLGTDVDNQAVRVST